MSEDFVALLDDRLRAQRQDFDEVPIVDISRLRDGTDPQAVAREIRWALSNVGFMYIKGHGVPDHIYQEAFLATQRFFALPDAEKMTLHIAQSGQALRGYTEMFGENTNPDVTRDYKECYDVGIEYPGLTAPFHGKNQWPELNSFQEPISTYLDAMRDLSVTLLEGIAISLNLDPNYFANKRAQPIMIQRMLHYPSQAGIIDERKIGIGAHTDYGLMTILAQDDVGGLQVLNRSGDWIEAPPIPGTFVVNISDLVQRLTNDTYIANMHRVVNISGRERYSMPCFVDCDYEAEISPLSDYIPQETPSAYDPVQCGQHKYSRYKASFPHLNDL